MGSIGQVIGESKVQMGDLIDLRRGRRQKGEEGVAFLVIFVDGRSPVHENHMHKEGAER